MITVLVNGAQGQLAQELSFIVNHAPTGTFDFIFLTRREWDITDHKVTDEIIKTYQPQIIVNTAAYTKVDQAEIEIEECFNINSRAVKYLAEVCLKYQIKLIHYSSDYVFHEIKERVPIDESHIKSAKGIYAESKSQAEDYIEEINQDAIIIRSSWIYSSYGHNFVKTMLRLSEQYQEIKVVNDQIGSPTYAYNIASVTFTIITELHYKKMKGIYHLTDKAQISWYDFAKEIFAQLHKNINLIPISTQEFNAKAPRPEYSVLNCNKIENELHIQMKDWKESLHQCIHKILS